MGPADAPGFDVGGQNDSVFEVCRRSCTFGANFVRTQQNTVKTDTRGTSEFSRNKTKPTKNRSEDAFEAARCSAGARTAHREGLAIVLERLRGARRGFWTAPGRSWLARGAPRSALCRHLGVQKPSRARPDASPKRLGRSKRLKIDFSSILGRSGVDFRRVLDDFSSIYARAACDEGTKAESQKRVARSSAHVLALALWTRFVLLAHLSK